MKEISHDPADAVMQSELRADLCDALFELDDSLRTPILLRYQEGLTLAAIGRVVESSESTVHERIHRGLARLRARLSGSLGAGVSIERILMSAGQPAVPASMATRLLAIPSAVAPVAVGKVAFLAAALVVLGAAGFLLARTDKPIGASSSTSSVAADHRAPDQPGVAGAADAGGPTLLRTVIGSAADQSNASEGGATGADTPAAVGPNPSGVATLGGLAVDPTEGRGIPGVEVVAHCPELDRKATPFELAVKTDSLGRFSIEVPIRHVDGMRWELGARHGATRISTPLSLDLRPGDRRLDLRIEVVAPDEDPRGAWARLVRVFDPARRPVAGVTIAVARRIGSASFERFVDEAHVRTDTDGLATLAGTHLGQKRLRVVPFGLPFRVAEHALVVDEASAPELTVELVDDVPRTIRLLDAGNDTPLHDVSVWAERDGVTLAVGRSDTSGLLVLRGLDERPCDLIGGGGIWSTFRLRAVLPSSRPDEPQTVRMKRLDDPRAIGAFTPEVHGRVIDAATGEPIVVECGDVFLRGLPATATAHDMESLRRNLLTPTPWQTAMFGEPPPPSPEFHLAAWSTGRFAVVLYGTGFAPAVAGPFDLLDGTLIADVELRAEPGLDLSVEVLDSSGRPLPDAEVWIASDDPADDHARVARAAELQRAAESGRRPHAGRGLRTDARGLATFSRIPAGLVFAVHAAHASGEHARLGSIQLRAGATSEPSKVRLVRGS